MLLYIVYVEPLLIFIRNNTSGLHFGGIQENIEAYRDDVNAIACDDKDLIEIVSAISKFWGIEHKHNV